jgi:hypothetical protein
MIELAAVIAAFEEVLTRKGENAPIDAGSLLADLHCDSLDFAEVLIVLEEQIGEEVTVDRPIAGATIRDFHDLLAIRSDRRS